MDRQTRRHTCTVTACILLVVNACGFSAGVDRQKRSDSAQTIHVDTTTRIIRITNNQLRLRVSYDRCCVIDSMSIGNRRISGVGSKSFTGCQLDSSWYTTQRLTQIPVLSDFADSVSLRSICYAVGRDTVTEVWSFSFDRSDLVWTIDRTLLRPLVLDDNAFPAIHIDTMDLFEGALLGNGGAAWFRLFNDSAIAFGVHTDAVTFWSMRDQECLQLVSRPGKDQPALNMARMDRSLRCSFSVSPRALSYRLDEGTHRRRFIRGRTDVWQRATYPAGVYRQVLRLSAPRFHDKLGRGEFNGIDGAAVTALLNTIARLGVIDSKHYGGNSWHTPYGPICIQEQYIAQLGLGINDENYIHGYKECLDYYRDHAIQTDGRIKARWAYTNEDAIPGTADSLGFYEAQWGIMMDSQPDFVINVAELFDLCGDVAWLKSHKRSCEKVLDYILRRDTDHDYLVEMITQSHKEGRGSDWLDIMWASWENAFVNAELYWALTLWSDLENLLGDTKKADYYRQFAAGLKKSYNKSTGKGGFWDEQHRWYVHWRDKDGSVHGSNLVTPVNFMAIGYGICDDPQRRLSILHAIEAEMQRENLFVWPICVFPYESGAGHRNNYPFPSYENGDLFLSWGELGVRAYAQEFPEVALHYCKNVIERYKTDGLAYQRYLRITQQGSGDDILAGNALTVVGLFRNIYGVQPRYNRLVLRPRLVKELYGTRLRYRFQGKVYDIALDGPVNSVAVDGTTIRSDRDFGIKSDGSLITWFNGESISPSIILDPSDTSALSITIREWKDQRSWTTCSSSGRISVTYRIENLQANRDYAIYCDGYLLETDHASSSGSVQFTHTHHDRDEHLFEVRAVSIPVHLRGKPLIALARPTLSHGDTILFSPGSLLVRIDSDTPGAIIRYTRDGSEPGDQSELYVAPLNIAATTVVKARASRGGMSTSEVASATYTVLPSGFAGIVESGGRMYAFHKGLHNDVTLKNPYQSKYRGSGRKALTDGILGNERYDLHWQGFERDDLEATVDLGRVMVIDSIRVGFLQDLGVWIFFPLEVGLSVSADGRHYEVLSSPASTERSYRNASRRRDYVYRGRSLQARYVRVHATSQGLCPPGHPGAGGKAWLFVDEIVVQ